MSWFHLQKTTKAHLKTGWGLSKVSVKLKETLGKITVTESDRKKSRLFFKEKSHVNQNAFYGTTNYREHNF